MTGGYLYHRRVADRAAGKRRTNRLPVAADSRFPLPLLAGRGRCGAVAPSGPTSCCSTASRPRSSVRGCPSTRRLPPVVGDPAPAAGRHRPRPLRADRCRRVLDRAAYRRVSRLLVASADLADTLRRRRAARRADCGSCRRAATRRRTGRRPPVTCGAGRRAAVLSVGNWVARKGLLDLLEAVAALPADAVTLHLRRRRRRCRAGVRRPGAGPACRGRTWPAASWCTALYRPAEVVGFYRAADVFALASLREPYGTVYGEAMAAGLPVVGWDAGQPAAPGTERRRGPGGAPR